MEHLAPEVRYSLLGIAVALVISTLAITGAKWMFGRDRDGELVSRIKTWWVIVGLFVVAILPSSSSAVWLFAFVSFLALKEFLSMTPTRRADRRVLFYAYASIPLQYYFAAVNWYGMFIVFLPVIMFIALPARMITIGQTDGFLRAAGTLHWGLMLTVFSLSHVAILLMFDPGSSGQARLLGQYPSEIGKLYPGPGLLLFLVLMTELNDIFQFCWGKSIGGSKVAPSVSPGKTYAGLIGGALTTIVVSLLLAPRLTLMDWKCSAIAGVIIAFAGFFGDLCMSSLKRDLKIKDFGATLPGHGGVLDRVDSLIFTAPLFFHFVYYFYG
ncbi:phosphatidate cytidylyltransferase [Rhodopirellula sp. MGV]|uniref:phosphatidate cytidylyltransferase n=1 Tax=Rhodopirellula sp. MGV TaxID=2023130 RepID=UPI000B968081|nr:phosphatidate cytidylyltransferase [Rhodopirellula sp. MGV]OYP38389.1 phosphatidate cytidylyltransferase [Rhodopirellula sp. MGV]PNY34189.1 phosphatidate cytidylyltransferase [Rhodopirellula baltica]